MLCREYAKQNRCVFKCFANVSKPKKKTTNQQPKHSNWPGTKKVHSALVCKISRGRTTQALKHNHAQFVCYSMRCWYGSQCKSIRAGVNVIKALQAKNQTSSRIQHWLQLLDNRPRQTCTNTIAVIQPTMNQCMHQEKFWFNRQDLPQSTDESKLEIEVLTNTQDMLRHSSCCYRA